MSIVIKEVAVATRLASRDLNRLQNEDRPIKLSPGHSLRSFRPSDSEEMSNGDMAANPDPQGLPGMIGRSEHLQQVFRVVHKVATSSATVLIIGETGTGKELVARALHECSNRQTGPFIRVNCGAISESLFESELFGHIKGSFTGALENRTGRIEAAHGGTIFLDEIHSLSQLLQVKLLRFLQEKEFERVGDTKTTRVDVRVVAATNLDLEDEVVKGRFRQDLYYRLNVIPIAVPPLRSRAEDIPLLAAHFAYRVCLQSGWSYFGIPDDVIGLLQQHDWPGNVRELQNVIERAIILGGTGELKTEFLTVVHRGHSVQATPKGVGAFLSLLNTSELCSEFVQQLRQRLNPPTGSVLAQLVALVERETIRQSLAENFGVRSRVAKLLGLHRNKLQRKMDEYGLAAGAK